MRAAHAPPEEAALSPAAIAVRRVPMHRRRRGLCSRAGSTSQTALHQQPLQCAGTAVVAAEEAVEAAHMALQKLRWSAEQGLAGRSIAVGALLATSARALVELADLVDA